jgi:hypothetical protein
MSRPHVEIGESNGWVDGPKEKPANRYLSNPTWVGPTEGVASAYPWGLGSVCHYATAYVRSVQNTLGWCARKTFAALSGADAEAAAREWLSGQEPEL